MNNRYGRLVMLMLLIGATGLLPGRVGAHGGLSLAEDKCVLSLGPYWMHFAGYQPQSAGSKEFCEDVPEVGHMVVALDSIGPELRSMPIEVRVVRDTGDLSNLDAITVLHVPPKIYATGSVTFEHTFDKPGKFIGIITATDKEPLVSQFPFSVGGGSSVLMQYLPFIGILVAGGFFYWYSAVSRAKKMVADEKEVPDA